MSSGLGLEVCFGDDDHMQRLRTVLVEQFRLIPPGMDVPLYMGRDYAKTWPNAWVGMLLAMMI
jgi:hypothetical protein